MLAFVLVIAMAFPVFAAESVSYVNRTADATGKVTEEAATCETYTVVAGDSTTWSDGWYAVNSNVTIDSLVTVSEAVSLILCDGFTLTVTGSIQLTGSNSLTIYGQNADTGTLTISNVADKQAGIGGGNNGAGGTTTINGGTVTANGGSYGAGIGGGYQGAGGTITINGGNVTATGGNGGAGIGGGNNGAGGTITLSYTSDTDSITASSYNGTVTISDGKKFTDGTNEYSGSVDDLSAIAGKTLTPYMYTLTLGDNITADYDGKVPAGLTVTLTYSLSVGYEAVFSVNGSEIEGSTFTMPAENVTITAELIPIIYTITYTLDGGSVATDNPTSYTIETETFTLNNPTKKYYTFAGWTGTGLDAATETVKIEQGSTGDREYTATWEQHGFRPNDESTPQFAAYSMVLGGTLSVRYYVYLPSTYNSADCTIVFDVSGDTSLNPDPCAPVKAIASGDATLYGYDCYINSAQMADEIHATLYYDGNSKTLDADPYSAEEYLDTVASTPENYEDYELALIEAIRDYGHYVQPMLSDANGWEIGKQYAYMHSDTTYSTESIDVVSGAVSEHKIVRDTGSSGIDNVKFSLSLGANTTINLYLYVSDSYTGEVSASLDGETENLAVKLSDKLYRVKLTDIAAHNLSKFFTVNVTAGETFTVNVSALCYVNTVLALDKDAGETDDNERNGVVSLYRYYDATTNYNTKKAGE